jgi:phosphoribosylformimino-5-aminoimidazole carboxamide ribotide isomerase
MKFRPCIDLHAGVVKQIVGSTLKDVIAIPATEAGTDCAAEAKDKGDASSLSTNFSTERPAYEFAEMYKRDQLTGGHVIMLGPGNLEAAKSALQAYPGGLQVGGGINLDNALSWLEAGASHVIVTSFVFRDGTIDFDRLKKLVDLVGKERLVLDLSCRRRPEDNLELGPYFVVTDRWQNFTDVALDRETLHGLGQFCDEFLVHGVENEGKRCGILADLVELLGEHSPISVTYAGGVKELADLDKVKELGKGKVDLTIGSALDCFGGDISYVAVVEWHKKQNSDPTG